MPRQPMERARRRARSIGWRGWGRPCAALNSLAVAAPAWLRAQAPEAWHDRYDQRVEE